MGGALGRVPNKINIILRDLNRTATVPPAEIYMNHEETLDN